MQLRHLLIAATLAAAASLSAPHAYAFSPSFSGSLCSATEVPSGTDGLRAVIIRGGPFAGFDSDSPTDVAEVYIFCTVQVGGTGYASDPDVAEVDAEGDGVAMVPPTRATFADTSADEVIACTEIWIATGDGHFSIYLGADGAGFDSPSEAHCGAGAVVVNVECPPEVNCPGEAASMKE